MASAAAVEREEQLRHLLRVCLRRSSAAAAAAALRTAAPKLSSDTRSRWNQPEAASKVNGWTVLFEVMGEPEWVQARGCFCNGGQAGVVQALLDAGIGDTMALSAFVMQPAFRSDNPHHNEVFQLLLTRMHENDRLRASLTTLAKRCLDDKWRKAIETACFQPTPAFAALCAQEVERMVQKRKAETAAAAAAAAAAAVAAAAVAAASELDEPEEHSRGPKRRSGGRGKGSSTVDESDGEESDGDAELPASKKSRKGNSKKVPARPKRTETAIRKSIDELIGLWQFKKQVCAFVNTMKDEEMLRKKGGQVPQYRNHVLFFGPPGVGKTMCAGLLAELLHAIGFLSEGHLVESKGVDLLARHVGGTPTQVHKITGSAAGGVLFIDELYGVGAGVSSEGHNYNKEAVDTLLSDLDKPGWICVGAGYEKEMSAFLKLNPGLARRFRHQLTLEPYSMDDLGRIFADKMAHSKIPLVPESDVVQRVKEVLQQRQARHFGAWGNAGEVDTLIAAIRDRRVERMLLLDQAAREAMSLEEYQTTTLEDIPSEW